MSVLACDRRGCEHIMCERLILNGSRYICDECWDELREAKLTWPDKMTALEVWGAIENFMETPRGTYRVLDREGINEEFERLTRENDHD